MTTGSEAVPWSKSVPLTFTWPAVGSLTTLAAGIVRAISSIDAKGRRNYIDHARIDRQCGVRTQAARQRDPVGPAASLNISRKRREGAVGETQVGRITGVTRKGVARERDVGDTRGIHPMIATVLQCAIRDMNGRTGCADIACAATAVRDDDMIEHGIEACRPEVNALPVSGRGRSG